MKKAFYMNVLTLSLVCAVLSFPGTGLAENKDKEEMMWRGFILMEAVEKHAYDIGPSEKLNWRHGMKSHFKSQRATIQVLSADPLGSGDTKLSGMVYAEIQDEEIFEVRPPAEKCNRSWVLNKDTRQANGSAMIRDNQIRIMFAKKSHMDAAGAIQEAIRKCGTDEDCLARVYDRFKGVVEDPSKSFPIKMVVQCFPSCPGVIRTHSLRMRGQNCKNEEKTERDDSRDIRTELCLPMRFEMDGTYTRSKDGDQITAYFQDSDQNPYKGFDGEDHPIEWQTRCTVNLTNGPPEVRIYRLTEDALPKDITDKEEKVLVGEKVKLQGEVVGTGLGEEILRVWKVPGQVIKDWRASIEKADIIYFDEDNFEKGIVQFTWSDGSYGGEEKTVKYTADYMGIELEGETRFKVFEPRVKWLEKKLGTFVGIRQKQIVQDGTLQRIECEMTPESPAIFLKAKVTVPDGFEGARNCLQFVQLTSTNAWFLRRYTPDYNWFKIFFVDYCDSTYPYSGPVCGGKDSVLEMRDSPGDPLAYMNAAFDDSRFRTYLMFRPGSDDRSSVWVPLKLIEWGWKGSVTHTSTIYNDNQPPCAGRYRLTCERPPSRYDFNESDSPVHPKWDGYYDESKLVPINTRISTQNPQATPPANQGDWSGWQCP